MIYRQFRSCFYECPGGLEPPIVYADPEFYNKTHSIWFLQGSHSAWNLDLSRAQIDFVTEQGCWNSKFVITEIFKNAFVENKASQRTRMQIRMECVIWSWNLSNNQKNWTNIFKKIFWVKWAAWASTHVYLQKILFTRKSKISNTKTGQNVGA